MAKQIFVMYMVAKNQCPEGDWQPTIHRDKQGRIYAVSAWPELTSMPGTWIAEPGCSIVGPGMEVEKAEHGELITITLYKKVQDDCL